MILSQLSKVERLDLAARIAPVIRRQYLGARRRAFTYDRATNEILRECTLADVWRGLLRAKQIEMDLETGPPPQIVCEDCRRLVDRKSRHEKQRLWRCDDCEEARREIRELRRELAWRWEHALKAYDLRTMLELELEHLRALGFNMFPGDQIGCLGYEGHLCHQLAPATARRRAGIEWRCPCCAYAARTSKRGSVEGAPQRCETTAVDGNRQKGPLST